MADADWAKYKQLRGKTLPESITFRGVEYRLEQLFKRDFYAATGLFRRNAQQSDNLPACPTDLPDRVVLKVYHTEPLGILPLRWLGRFLCNREVYFYQATDGIPGLARFLERHGEAGHGREYVPGVHLRDYRKTNRIGDFFYRRLDAMLTAVHARGTAHTDRGTAENILVRPDGSPTLIDFQIATTFDYRFPLLRYLGRHLLPYMQSVDRYHIGKHKRKDRPQDFTEVELQKTRRKGLVLTLHGWMLRRPYRMVRHLIMDRFMRVTARSEATDTESARSTDQLPPARAG